MQLFYRDTITHIKKLPLSWLLQIKYLTDVKRTVVKVTSFCSKIQKIICSHIYENKRTLNNL